MTITVISKAGTLLDSPARVAAPERAPFRVAAVQHRWHDDPTVHETALAEAVRAAAGEGARLVCLQELTLSRYFAVTPHGPSAAGAVAERLPGGPTHDFAARMARETDVFVHASLYEAAGDGGLGFNTAICVAPDGTLLARGRAKRTFPSPPVTTRTSTSGPATTASPSSRSAMRASVSRPAGTNGFPSSRGPTRCVAPT